jgi:hypothetical protein
LPGLNLLLLVYDFTFRAIQPLVRVDIELVDPQFPDFVDGRLAANLAASGRIVAGYPLVVQVRHVHTGFQHADPNLLNHNTPQFMISIG